MARTNKISIICPSCDTEIKTLNNVQSGLKTWEMNKNGKYKEIDFDADDVVNTWECPECDYEIANSEEDAIKFLRTGKIE